MAIEKDIKDALEALGFRIDALPNLSSVTQLVGEQFYPETYGAVGDGVTNDQAAVQTAVNNAASVSGTAVLNNQYLCNSQILLRDNAHIHLPYKSSKLIKNFAVGGGTSLSFLATVDGSGKITNTNGGARVNDVKITGPGVIGCTSTTMTGNILGIYGDRFIARDFTIDTWGGGKAMIGAGDQWRAYNVTARNSDGNIGSGGWRYAGGMDSTFVALNITSGDDALQLVPVATQNLSSLPPMYDIPIERCWYIGCTGASISARFMACLLENSGAATNSGMHGHIIDSGWIGCHGYGGNRAIWIYNPSSDGTTNNGIAMDGIHVIECSIDMVNNPAISLQGTITNTSNVVSNIDTTNLEVDMTVAGSFIPGGAYIGVISGSGPGSSFTMVNSAGAAVNATSSGTETITMHGQSQSIGIQNPVTNPGGIVRNVNFKGVVLRNPQHTKNALSTSGSNILDVVVEDCDLVSGPSATAGIIDLLGVSSARVRGGTFDLQGNTSLLRGIRAGGGGGSPQPSSDVAIEGVHVKGVPNGIYAFSYENSTGGRIVGNKVEPAGGATTPHTYRVLAACSGIIIHDNDFSAMPNNPSGSDSGTGTIIYQNTGDSTVKNFVSDPSKLSAPPYISGRWYAIGGTKASFTPTATTVSKLYAIRVPTWMYGKTCTGLALNQTAAPVLGGGTPAVSCTLKMALVPDSNGSPSTAIISGTEVSVDAVAAGTAAISGTFAGTVIPTGCWIVAVYETPTGTPSLGTLGTYPTYDIVNTQVDGISPSASASTGAPVSEYNESGQTTFSGTLAGMTLPAMTQAGANCPRIQLQLT